MKKLVLFFSILVLMTLSLTAVNVLQVGSKNDVRLISSSATSLLLHYDVDKVESFDISTKNGTFSSLSIEDYTSTNELGTPALPLNRRLISVPLGATVSLKISNSTSHEYSLQTAGVKFPIMPAQASVSKSSDPATLPFAYKSAAYMLNQYTDKPLIHVEELGIMRGVRLFAIDFEPVQYNPTTKMIKVWNNADVQVTFNDADLYATEQLRLKTYSPAFEGVYANSLINYGPVNDRASNLRSPMGYLIISAPALSSTMASFVTWKKQQGYNVTLVTTATTGTTTTAIKAYIQNIWTNATVANPAPSFLLLVGDIAEIPSFTSTTTSGHVSDLSYARLSGTDYVPEMYYGRFSASTTSDLQNIIDKTLMFEKTTMPDKTYLGKVDMIAGQDATFGPTHGDGQINYGTINYFNAAHGITSSTYLYAVSGTSDAQIIADVSAGRGYVNYTAHGDWDRWYDPTFTIANVATLTNTNKPAVMVGNCCLTNHFDDTVCFGEALTRAANKGAVAYIGGTNSTLWDEDYWWGVGAKKTTAQITSAGGVAPAWVASKIGTYDAIFHEHSEASTDWATFMGAMIYMGNLAVTQAASSNTNYYWEIYSVMGDPSLSPYMGVPATNAVTAPGTVLIGATSFTVQAAVNSYVCLSQGGTIYGVGTIGSGGSLTMTITPFTTAGTADLVITCQNKITYISSITIAPSSGAYMTVDSNVYADGVNNVLESNETGHFNTTFKNIGTATATNTVATLSTTASGITITDNSETIASLAAGASTTVNSAYTFSTANNIADQTSIPFHIAMVSGTSTWTYDANSIINAPVLAFGTITISDPTGNNNGRIDPGETVTVSIPLNNTGHAATATGTVTMASTTSGVTVTNGTYNAASISASGTATATFTMTVASNVAVGSVVTLNFNATAGAYTASKTETPAVGIVSETFETGNLLSQSWITVGTPAWAVVNTGAHGGTYCAKSGAITNSQTIDLKVTMNITTAGNISFYQMVSSESGYDFLKFYIDATETGSWSGTTATAYTQASYPVTVGSHTFKWTYLKDGSTATGSDCAWIDDIVFPPTSGSVYTFDPPRTPAAVAKNGAVTLTWTAPATGTPASYKVYRGGVAVASSITGLTYTNTGLTNGTSYSFYVTAVYTSPASGESAASSTVSAIPIAAIPTGLAAVAKNGKVSLTWVAPTTETPTGYNVYRNSVKITATPITALTYSDTGLTNGTSYSYYVTSVFTSPAAESAASSTVSATPIASIPTSLAAVAKNGTVNLTWTAPTLETPNGYNVYRNGTKITATPITTTTYSSTGLTNGTSYTFYVTSVYTTPAGESAASSTVSATPIAAIPTTLTATAGNALVNLSWTAPTTETPNGYNVYRNSTKITATPITTTTYSDTGLTNGTSYTYYVTSVFTTPAGESASSNTASATPNSSSVVTIGTGTASTSRYPLSSYWGYERQASLFTSTEVGTTGNIQTLSWWPTVTTTASIPVKIYMTTQTGTTIASATWATLISGATTVYNGTIAGLTAGAWKTIDITDFAYTTNNLLIMVECNYGSSGSGSSTGAAFRYTASATNMVESWAADDTAPTTTGTLSTNRPNIQMAIGAISTNPIFSVSPTSLTFSTTMINTTTATQTLTVTNTGGGTLTISSCAKIGTDAAMFSLTDTNTYSKVLTSGQSMTVTVAFAPTSVGAKTAAIRFTDTLTKSTHDVALTGTGYNPTITSFPFSESFDGTTFAPADWTNQRLVGTYSPGTWDRQTAGTNPTCTPHSGLGMARYNSYTITANTHGVLSTPPMNITTNSFRVTFWMYRDVNTTYTTSKYSDEGVSVWYGTSPTDTTLCTKLGFVPLNSTFAPTVTTAGWYQYTYSFGTGSAGNAKYVIFKGKSQYGDNIFMDDVTIDAAVAAPVFSMSPASLDFGTVTTGQTATRTFTITNSGGASMTGNITPPTGYSVVQTSKVTNSVLDKTRSTLAYTLGIGATGTFTVTFTPTLGQTYSGSVAITSNDTNHLTNSLTVTGIGVTPPEISVNPIALTKDIIPNETGSDTVTISNAGGMNLNYTIALQASKSIGGSTFSCTPTSFTPGNTVALTLTVYNGSTDTEWIKDINLTLPTGVTVVSSTSFIGGSGGDMVSSGTTGNGVTINWHGETTSGWGFVRDTESATCTVNISTLGSFAGDLTLSYQISGDVYGAEPHVINSSLSLSNLGSTVPWLSVAPASGTIIGGGSADLVVSYNSTGMIAGTYNAAILINSNDTSAPLKEVAVTMNVGIVNHAPSIALPAAWNYDKGTTLIKDFTTYINDADSDPISITYSGNTHIHILVNNHSVTFSSDENWVGMENITFTVDDGQGGTNLDQIAITVNPVNTPAWTPVVYPNNSATIYSLVTIDGLPAIAGDIVGAFVNDECRGTGTVVSDRSAYVTMLINVAANGETIHFKLYDSGSDVLYDAENTITVNIGETQGGPGNYVPVEVVTSVAAPSNVHLQMQASDFTIAWPVVQNANTYHVYRSATPDGDYVEIAVVHTNSYNAIDATARMYFYKVTAEKVVSK